jgi:hypothetical protein
MDVIFTRTSKKTYTTLARRDDGVTLEVQSFDRTSRMPHGIAHLGRSEFAGLLLLLRQR